MCAEDRNGARQKEEFLIRILVWAQGGLLEECLPGLSNSWELLPSMLLTQTPPAREDPGAYERTKQHLIDNPKRFVTQLWLYSSHGMPPLRRASFCTAEHLL